MQSSRHEQRGGEVVPGTGSRRRWAALVTLVATLVAVPFALQGNAGAGVAAPQLAAVTCDGGTYKVVRGDSWYAIASRLKVNVLALLGANSATVATVIHPGDVLCLPAGAATTVSTTSAPPTTAPRTTVPAVTTTAPKPAAATIRQFPVQGQCWFSDTWGAPRSGGRSHQGVDIIAPLGKAVYAADDGTLTKQYVDSPGALSGNGWRLTRADGTYYFYGHFSRFAPGLAVGSKVKAGQIIGYVGMTGNAGVPHLHFEVHPGGGAPVNPTPVVKAVDGCSVTAIVPQPGVGVTTTTAVTTTTVKGGVTTTTKPVTTTTKPAVTTTTKPVTTTTVKGGVTTTTKPVTTTTKPVTTTTKPVTTTTKPVTTTTTTPPTTTTTTPPPARTKWQFVTPVMALNTVLEGRRLVPGRQESVTVNGLAGVSPSTTGVMLRIVVRNISAAGNLTVHACGTASSAPVTLAYAPDRLSAVVAVAAVRNGTFCITATTAVDLRVAVTGQLATTGTTRQAISPRTVIVGPVAAGGSKNLTAAQLGQPGGAQAVQLTITLAAPTGAGSIGVGPCGGTPWILAFPANSKQSFTIVVRTNGAGVCLTPSVGTSVTARAEAFWVG